MNFRNFPAIPVGRSIQGWEKVKIHECGEKLVPSSLLNSNQVSIEPRYFRQNLINTYNECFVRESVISLLQQVALKLPEGFVLVVWDAWRPLKVQQQLFESLKKKIKNEHLEWNDKMIYNEAQRYVSFPSADYDKPSPHYTGGAIDIAIKKDQFTYLDMGTPFDDFSKKSRTRYYEEKLESGITLSSEEFTYLNNRRFLYDLMTNVGFTNYPQEWWHFDYGNQFWGKLIGRDAIYGRINWEVQN
jgi:D-alanyl-D-alanine dipeptidase